MLELNNLLAVNMYKTVKQEGTKMLVWCPYSMREQPVKKSPKCRAP